MGKNIEFMRFHCGFTHDLIKISNERSNYLNINLFTGDQTTILKLLFFVPNNPLQFHYLQSHLSRLQTLHKQEESLIKDANILDQNKKSGCEIVFVLVRLI